METGDSFDAWTCHPALQPGDVALLYRADLLKDFSHLFRIDEGPFFDRALAEEFGSSSACACTIVAALQTPVRLEQVRQDPVLSAWRAALVNFHGTAFQLERPEWRAFLALANPLDRPRLRAAGGET